MLVFSNYAKNYASTIYKKPKGGKGAIEGWGTFSVKLFL